MHLNDFVYQLPESLIARYPAAHRTESRLLCLDAKGQIEHRVFSEFVDCLHPGDLLVLNDTRVMPARLYASKATGGKVEILVERLLPNQEMRVHVKSNHPLKIDMRLFLKVESVLSDNAEPCSFVVLARDPNNGMYTLRYEGKGDMEAILTAHGEIPLPPYVNRLAEEIDVERYQTIYAKKNGAVAVPSAGLHFDDKILDCIQAKGVELAWVTLHVGAGTFLPVRCENLDEHQMHREVMEISDQVVAQIQRTKKRGGRVVAVGTTSVRSLETAAFSGTVKPYQGETDLFIRPGFQFRVVDAMLTNFHVPASTLLMLVSAFASRERILNAYQIAIEKGYRFYSYGDAMFIQGAPLKF